MRAAPVLFVLMTAAGCHQPGGPASPDQAVRGYVLARTVDDRLRFVFDADAVRPLLPSRAGMSRFGFDQVGVQAPDRLRRAGEWYAIRATARRGPETAEMRFYVG